MNYVVLARKWRPQQFEELVGQETLTRALQNAIKLSRVPHALLFTGTRGVGKTTTARILAKALNCEKGPTVRPCGICSNCVEIALGTNVDVLEIDGASNTSVDDIRELRETVKYVPSKSRHKIYIIDEVHMLSNSAFNALLKTLEEPPPGVIFMFATTEPQKIPDTILSRCQRFDLKAVTEEKIFAHLKHIVEEEKIQISEQGIAMVAKQAQGSIRDSLSILDQVIALAENPDEGVKDQDISMILGLTDLVVVENTIECFLNKDPNGLFQILQNVFEQGVDLQNYVLELIETTRNILLIKIGVDAQTLLVSPDFVDTLTSWKDRSEEQELHRWFEVLKRTYLDIARVQFPKFLLEVNFLKLTRALDYQEISQTIRSLESNEPIQMNEAVKVQRNAKPIMPAQIKSVPDEKTPKEVSKNDSKWDSLVQHLKKNKPAVAAIMVQAQSHSWEGHQLQIFFPKGSFYFDRAKTPEFKEDIENAYQETQNSQVSLEVFEGEAKPVKAAKPERQKIEKQSIEHPSVQKVMSLFDAKVDEIKPVKS